MYYSKIIALSILSILLTSICFKKETDLAIFSKEAFINFKIDSVSFASNYTSGPACGGRKYKCKKDSTTWSNARFESLGSSIQVSFFLPDNYKIMSTYKLNTKYEVTSSLGRCPLSLWISFRPDKKKGIGYISESNDNLDTQYFILNKMEEKKSQYSGGEQKVFYLSGSIKCKLLNDEDSTFKSLSGTFRVPVCIPIN